jgi:hypothetical protein
VDLRIPVDTGDFRLISRRAVDILNNMPERHRFIPDMASWIGLKQVPLRYAGNARFAGETNTRSADDFVRYRGHYRVFGRAPADCIPSRHRSRLIKIPLGTQYYVTGRNA